MPETFRATVRRAANSILNPLGLHLARKERVFEMDGVLRRARQRGAYFGTIIDVGASDGSWSRRAQHFFPEAAFLLFEPLAEHQPALQRAAAARQWQIVAAAAGAAPGEVAFAVDPGLDGSGVAAPGTAGTRRVPVETVDSAIAKRALTGPYCLKLDTHGYEIPILEGAIRTLAATELLIVEAYNFTLTPSCLRFHELCAWLADQGFRCCDLADPMRRPGDGLLWQMDLAFVRADHPAFTNGSYV